MDLTNILNTKEGAAAAAASASAQHMLPMELQKTPHPSTVQDQDARSPSRSGVPSDTEGGPASPHSSVSPTMSEHSAYSIRTAHPAAQVAMSGVYGFASQLQQQQQHQQQLQHQVQLQQQHQQLATRGPGRPSSGDPTQKAFPCSSCGKGFARRSDLARHERIHSGIRPHVCDYPGCEKQFIQRSALTVHARVHTGEKPHMCETCGKPFSDSSSLARHRRIHSGKRPYKCPYADCQKTFTRRTTLTRHQNHHTGTIGEAAAATAAALAARQSLPRAGRPPRSPTIGSDSRPPSSHSAPSTGPSSPSMSPAPELPAPFMYHRSNGSITSHPAALLTRDLQPLTPQPTPTPTPTLQTSMVSSMNRPPPTSNPSPYLATINGGSLPPILEPSPKVEGQRPGSPHLSGSPHMSSAGSPHMSAAGSPIMSRGSPHLSSIGYHSPSYPASAASADEQFYFPPPQTSSFQHSASPEPNYYETSLHRTRSNELMGSYQSQDRKVSSTA